MHQNNKFARSTHTITCLSIRSSNLYIYFYIFYNQRVQKYKYVVFYFLFKE